MEKVKYSIVVPAYNEEEAAPIFYKTIIPIMEQTGESFEIVIVNDGSKDKTEQILAEIAKNDTRVKVINFSRNFGQQAALLCGLQATTGEAIIDLDIDLQDPPELILSMIAKWKEGYDVVHGKRKKRKGESVFKKVTAHFYYRFLRKITNMDIPKDTGDFKLFDRKVIDAILSMSEHSRLLRVQTTWVGFKQCFIEFDRPERTVGETKYTLKKMIKLATDGIIPNSDYPLFLPLKLGIFFGVLSLVAFVTFIVLVCCGIALPLTAWLFPTIGCFSAIILACSGLANVYVGRIYEEVKDRPKYIVKDKINIK